MKKQNILAIFLILLGVGLIATGAVISYSGDEKKPVKEEGQKEEQPVQDENYKDLGAASLKEDQVFNNIKYTQNHLSTTDAESYATFTSVIFNNTGIDIAHKDLEIDFYDTSGNKIGTMESSFDSLPSGGSTMIFGIAELNLSAASSFNVREVVKETQPTE